MGHLPSSLAEVISVQIIVVNCVGNGVLKSAERLAEIWQSEGWKTATHAVVQDGLEYFCQELPNLVLLYVQRPTLESFEVCRQLRRLGSAYEIPIIFCSPVHDALAETRAHTAGAVDYWVDPLNPQEIVQRARMHIELQKSYREIVRLQEELAQYSQLNSQLTPMTQVGRRPLEVSDPAQLPWTGRGKGADFDWMELFNSLEEVFVAIAFTTQELLFATAAAEGLFGSPVADLLEHKKLWKQAIHPDDVAKVELSLRSLEENQKVEVEYRLLQADQSLRWVSARFYRKTENQQVVRVYGIISDITKRKQVEEDLMRRALFDDLTQIPNRTLFKQRLSDALNRTRRSADYRFAVLFVDLCRFKQINDTFGHWVGDQLLARVAKLLENCIRSVDMVARLGGDEFTLFLDDIKDVAYADQVVERIFEALHHPIYVDGHYLHINANIGITIGSHYYHQVDDLLRDADAAMYKAKSRGPGQFDFFGDTQTRTVPVPQAPRLLSTLRMTAQ